MASVPNLPLNTGAEIPQLGFGVFQIPPEETAAAVRVALAAGYRSIDTARIYRNEREVGETVAGSGLARDELFITTKVWNDDQGRAEARRAFDASLARLGLDHVDLYLVHWPGGDPAGPWPAMERAHEHGLTRSIGVSQYGVRELEAVVAGASVPPAVNQVEFNPFRYRRALLSACRERGVTLEAYSPLTTGSRLADPRVAEVAGRNGRTPAQVLLRWSVQRGVPVIPKSVRRERIEENARIFDFELPDADMAELDALDETGGSGEAHERPLWKRVAARVMRR